MTIDRDDSDERQLRLDWMIDEFQDARRRRLTMTGASGSELPRQQMMSPTPADDQSSAPPQQPDSPLPKAAARSLPT